jgi:flagellar hook-basal body complex protein FliE
MKESYIPKVQLKGDITNTKFYPFDKPARLENLNIDNEIPSFKDVMTGLVKNVDSTMKAPDQMLEDVILGNGTDIHDVMIAMSKAEITVNLATQMTSKVIQAYEKVISIQL